MKRYFFAALILCLTLGEVTAASYASPDSGFYIGALGGGTFLNRVTHDPLTYVDQKAGYLFGTAIGYRFCCPFRLEGEFTYRTNGIDLKTVNQETGGFTELSNGARITVYTYMANVYWETKLNCAIRPYVGIGAGYAQMRSRQDLDLPHLVFDGEGRVYQVIGGFSFPVCHRTELGFEYRYMNAQKNTHNHAILANLRFFFF